MIEIIMLVFAAIVLLAKHGKRPRRRYYAPTIDNVLALSTLADNTLISATFGASDPGQETWLMSARMTWSIDGHTAGEGPIIVGLAHEDYSDAEIEAYLENPAGWTPQDLVAQEISRRKIRIVGSFSGLTASESLFDGRAVKTKCNWRNGPADTLKVWAFQKSGAPLTTGTRLVNVGNAFYRPI